MSLNEANELKIMVETLCQMIDMLFVHRKECLCNQCIVVADGLRLVMFTGGNIFAAQKLSQNVLFLCILTIEELELKQEDMSPV